MVYSAIVRHQDRQCPTAAVANVQPIPHQWQAEPVVRRRAVHPAVAAVRGVRHREARPHRAAADADLPVPSTGPAPAQDPNNVARSGPEGSALEAFLKQPGLYPFPAQYSNVLDRNPWKAQIEAFLNRHSVGSPAEGRPPGKGWSHQRWNEFYPRPRSRLRKPGAHQPRPARSPPVAQLCPRRIRPGRLVLSDLGHS